MGSRRPSLTGEPGWTLRAFDAESLARRFVGYCFSPLSAGSRHQSRFCLAPTLAQWNFKNFSNDGALICAMPSSSQRSVATCCRKAQCGPRSASSSLRYCRRFSCANCLLAKAAVATSRQRSHRNSCQLSGPARRRIFDRAAGEVFDAGSQTPCFSAETRNAQQRLFGLCDQPGPAGNVLARGTAGDRCPPGWELGKIGCGCQDREIRCPGASRRA